MKKKILKILGVFILLVILICVYFALKFEPAAEVAWGLNFSQIRARELGFDPLTMYKDMITDLKPKQIRLNAYWSEIEPEKDRYEFVQMDEYLNFATENNVEVILSVGKKLPRWPECHQPDWVKQLSAQEQEVELMDMLTDTVEHFKPFTAIKIWQVENEPLFLFGHDCPKVAKELLKKEIALVQSLDSRPVLVTDAGEFGRWIPAASTGADLFGSTMYRVVHNPKYGYFKYPLPPWFFRIKAGALETFTDLQGPIIGVELQAEPWFAHGIENTSMEQQRALMNPKLFVEYTDYAKSVGFRENYLWGVEYWYWMAQKHNDWGLWGAAKELLTK